MYFDEILTVVKKHLKENSILIENAAINIPNGQPMGRLIDLKNEDDLKYSLVGRDGRRNYSYVEPIVEIEDGKKICTYVVYG